MTIPCTSLPGAASSARCASIPHIRDGVSFERLLTTRAFMEAQALGVQRIVLWAAMTLLVGNSDAHGKNISFHCRRSGLAVAELYDLVSVVQYPGVHHDLAMAFGDEFTLDAVRAFALADFCERCGIPRAYFARELRRLCAIAADAARAQAQDPVYEGDERPFVRHLGDFVAARAGQLLKMAPDIPKFARDNF